MAEGLMPLRIQVFEEPFENEVVELWRACGLLVPWNDPRLDIRRKLAKDRHLFLVGFVEDDRGARLSATVMGGYDGHRGWINYLAVHPQFRGRGLGRQILGAVEELLRAEGCPKINLQIRESNTGVQEFYEGAGYTRDASISMGKRLVHDDKGDIGG